MNTTSQSVLGNCSICIDILFCRRSIEAKNYYFFLFPFLFLVCKSMTTGEEIRQVAPWQRPEGSNPVCYYKFVSGNEKCDKLVEYKIRDIPENRYDEACKFMLSYFVPYEPKLVARNAQNDQNVLDDYTHMFMSALRQNISVGCFKRGSDEFAGINILEVIPRDYKNHNDCSYKVRK